MKLPKEKIIKDKAFFQRIGALGGNRTKAKYLNPNSPDYNPSYFKDNGEKGGSVMLKRGKEWYSRIGSMSPRKYQEVQGA